MLCIFSPCIMDLSADVCCMYHSYQLKMNEVRGSVIIFMFLSAFPLCTMPPHPFHAEDLPYVQEIRDGALFVAVRQEITERHRM